MNNGKNILLFILGATVIVLLLLLDKCGDRANGFEAMSVANADTLEITRNNLGQERSVVGLLSGSYDQLARQAAGKDTTLAKLQEIVNKRTISATILSNTTASSFTAPTIVTYDETELSTNELETNNSVDSTHICPVLFPKYNTSYTNRWERFNITATRDSFNVNYKVFNEFELTQNWQRYGFLKTKKRAITSVLNLNPNTETKELKTFTVECKCNKGKWFLGGLITGSLATIGGQIAVKQWIP